MSQGRTEPREIRRNAITQEEVGGALRSMRLVTRVALPGGERRGFAYAVHIPERRSGEDRRSGKDRRRYPRLVPGKLTVDAQGMVASVQMARAMKG